MYPDETQAGRRDHRNGSPGHGDPGFRAIDRWSRAQIDVVNAYQRYAHQWWTQLSAGTLTLESVNRMNTQLMESLTRIWQDSNGGAIPGWPNGNRVHGEESHDDK